MISIWTRLSWSHAALVVGVILLIVGTVALLIHALLAERAAPPRRPMLTVDYSREYQEKRAWLGDDFLLSKPINRTLNNSRQT